jgi:hypothetical protein
MSFDEMFAVGLADRSAGKWSASNAPTASACRLMKGTPNFTTPFDRSTIAATS